MNREEIRILLVEDNPGDARFVREVLLEDAGSDFHLSHVPTVAAALDRLAIEPVDVVLLDLSLPDETGLNTVRRVVAGTADASVVVMTGAGDEELGRAALQAGAQDYLVKGQVDGRLLRRALRFAIERHVVHQRLEDLSLKDDLTGLYNRRAFLLLAEQQARTARRQRTPFLLLFLDLDGLKHVNDTFGHAEGNRALVEAADVLRGSFRQSDILARLGGDEFAAFSLCSGMSDEPAIRARLSAVLQQVNGEPDRAYPIGFSIGVLACTPANDTRIETLLERADALMYVEKRGKRGALDLQVQGPPRN
jgi:diguanylate cyclase (GGDEF)-like protein